MVTLIIYTLAGWMIRYAAAGAELPRWRLDGSVVPHHYELEIFTGLNHDNFKFWGTVRIHVSCKKDTNRIILHSRNLTINERNVSLTEDVSSRFYLRQQIDIVRHTYNTKDDFYIIQTRDPLQAGKNYSYAIPFSGVLSEGKDGFYRSYYDDAVTKKRIWLATTQFEPADARQAFPCFDEPNMKATFQISVGHPGNYTAISNMPSVRTVAMPNKRGWVKDTFLTTFRMSTYLVAFVVCDFTHRHVVVSKSGVEFRIWAKSDSVQRGHTDFAENYGPKILDFYEKYYDIQYPLPKVDMIAIPHHKYDGMENWGLITFREDQLIYDPNTNTDEDLQTIALCIAHELAHQWFGNLVTMEWWSELWLNEGFASYVAIVGTHAVYPEWNIMDKEISNNLNLASTCSQSLLFPDLPVQELQGMFGKCTYSKGPIMVRAMNLFLGEEAFQEGLMNYLLKHKFGNVRQDDLYAALTESAHKKGVLHPNMTVKMIMDTWITQEGYPLLNVHRNYDTGAISVSVQQPHTSILAWQKNPTEQDKSVWWIPLTFTSRDTADFSKTIPSMWHHCRKGTMLLPGVKIKCGEWIIFNLQIVAPFKVHYDPKTWVYLRLALQDEAGYLKIHPLNRRQILEDVFQLARAGEVPYETAFGISKYIKHEREYLPLKTAYTNFRDIAIKLRGTPNYDIFKNFTRELVKPTLTSRGADSSLVVVPRDIKAREEKKLITKFASFYQIDAYENEATRLYRSWMKQWNPDSVNPIPKEFRKDVSCTAVEKGGEAEWNFLWTRFVNSDLAAERSKIVSALSCTKKEQILIRLLSRSIDHSLSMSSQDSVSIFREVALDNPGFTVAKIFLIQRVDDIYAFHGPRNRWMGDYIKALATHMNTRDDRDRIAAFTREHAEIFKYSLFDIKEAMDIIDNNLLWHESYYKDIPRFIEAAP